MRYDALQSKEGEPHNRRPPRYKSSKNSDTARSAEPSTKKRDICYAGTAASSDPDPHRYARTTFWHPRSAGHHAAGAHRGDPTALRKSRFAPILLLEGDQLRVDRSEMRPESIRGRSPTSRLSCACRSCQAAGRRIPRTWSMLRQNSARSGTRLAALRRGGPGLLCPSSRCRLCWPCHRARPALEQLLHAALLASGGS
jgi:hypothetical protein